MKAAVCREFGSPLVVEDVELAPPGPTELRVRLEACVICHSDIHYMEGAWGGPLPAVYGHEAAGVVSEAGHSVKSVRPDDHVVVTLIRSCGTCHFCTQGEPVLCEGSFALDERGPLTSADGEAIFQAMNTGAFAEEVVVEASQVAKIRDGIPWESAALLACGVITGFGAVVNAARVEPGSSVVVIGTGGVGLNSVQGARVSGAQPIIAVDVANEKLEAARAFGATHTVNPEDVDAVGAVRDLTGGRKADYVFVTVGAKPAIETGFRLMRRGGTVVLVGMPATGVTAEFDCTSLVEDGQRIIGTKMGSARIQVDIPRLVALYDEGRLKLDELVTGRYTLDEINAAVASVNRGEALRNVLVF